MAHKFIIGQIVDFDVKIVPRFKTSGPYKVLRLLPSENERSQRYAIKSTAETFERSADEYEIVATGRAS